MGHTRGVTPSGPTASLPPPVVEKKKSFAFPQASPSHPSLRLSMKLALLVIGLLAVLASSGCVKGQNSTFVFFEPNLNVTLNNQTISSANATLWDLAWRNMTYKDNKNTTNNATLGLDVLSTGNFSGNSTLLLGAAYTRSSNETARHLPVCVLSYFVKNPSGCWMVPNKTLDNWSTNTSRNTIASLAYALHELSDNGTVVNSFVFNALNWTRTGLNATAGDVKSLAVAEWTANLTLSNTTSSNSTNTTTPSSTPSATPSSTTNSTNTTSLNAQVYMAFVQSNQLGVLNVFDTPMVPKSWQTILRVTNYTFASANNSLQVELLALTASDANTSIAGVLSFESVATPKASNLYDEAYVLLSNESWVNATSWAPGTTLNTTALANASSSVLGNATAPANITSWEEVTNSSMADSEQLNATLPTFLPIIHEQLEMQYGTNISLYFANVTFAPATANLTYTYLTAIGRLNFTSNGTLETFGAASNNATNTSTTSFNPISNAVPTSAAHSSLQQGFSLGAIALCLISAFIGNL